MSGDKSSGGDEAMLIVNLFTILKTELSKAQLLVKQDVNTYAKWRVTPDDYKVHVVRVQDRSRR